MLASIFKYTFFAMTVLLVGQIPIGGETLGARFAHSVGQAGEWGAHEFRDSKLLAGVGDMSFIERWWKAATPPLKHAPARKEIVNRASEKTDAHDADGVSQADREALIRLLQ